MAEPSTTVSPPWAVRLIAGLDTADQRANVLMTGLQLDQLNWQPTAGSWSIGQCLEHLCVTNEVYLPAVSSSLAGKALSTVPEIAPGWFGRWFIGNFIEPSPQTRRVRAPKKVLPASRVEPSVLERFLRTNETARDVIRRASNHDVNRVRFQNPFIPLLRFTVGTGLEIVCRHERRHLLQAERVKQAPGFPQ